MIVARLAAAAGAYGLRFRDWAKLLLLDSGWRLLVEPAQSRCTGLAVCEAGGEKALHARDRNAALFWHVSLPFPTHSSLSIVSCIIRLVSCRGSTFDPAQHFIELDLHPQQDHRVLPPDLSQHGLRISERAERPTLQSGLQIIYRLGDRHANLASCNSSQWTSVQTSLCMALRSIVQGRAILELSIRDRGQLAGVSGAAASSSDTRHHSLGAAVYDEEDDEAVEYCSLMAISEADVLGGYGGPGAESAWRSLGLGADPDSTEEVDQLDSGKRRRTASH